MGRATSVLAGPTREMQLRGAAREEAVVGGEESPIVAGVVHSVQGRIGILLGNRREFDRDTCQISRLPFVFD